MREEKQNRGRKGDNKRGRIKKKEAKKVRKKGERERGRIEKEGFIEMYITKWREQ